MDLAKAKKENERVKRLLLGGITDGDDIRLTPIDWNEVVCVLKDIREGYATLTREEIAITSAISAVRFMQEAMGDGYYNYQPELHRLRKVDWETPFGKYSELLERYKRERAEGRE